MRKVCEVYLVSSASSDERGVELTFPVSQYEMMDAFEQIHTKSPGDVYWQVDEFYCFDYIAPHLDESMSIFEFNSLTEQLSKLDERQETALEGLLQMQADKHVQENSGIITVPELMMLASNVDHCQVLADVHSNEDLGKFYVENGFREDLDALPDSAYALLDYAKIGKQMRESEAGAFTPHGYVVRTEELEPHTPSPPTILALSRTPICRSSMRVRKADARSLTSSRKSTRPSAVKKNRILLPSNAHSAETSCMSSLCERIFCWQTSKAFFSFS